MNIFEYYFELLEKPKYMLSTAEQSFVLIICCIVEIIKNHK